MKNMLMLKAVYWSPIIQMSDGVNNKFKRTDGKPFHKGKNIYFFQQEFYDRLSDGKLTSISKGNRQNTYHIIDKNISFAIGFKGAKYFLNKNHDYTWTLYKVLDFIDVEFDGEVKTTMVAEDLTDTPEEFYINELWETTDSEAFEVVDLGWRFYSWQ